MMKSDYIKREKSVLKRRIQSLTGVVAVLALAFSIVVPGVGSTVLAQSAANTLRISPVRTDIEALPGERKSVAVTVTNPTSTDVVVKSIANDFIAGDESGTPALILDEDSFAPTRSLKRFMTPISDIDLPAGESKTINVNITIPADAKSGGYFGAIRFAPTIPDSGGQVNMSASVASIILLTIPGDVPEKLDLTNFDIQRDGQTGGFFMETDKMGVGIRFENKGGLQAGPFGKISVKKGDDVVYEADFNSKNPKDVILPDSARRWSVPLDKIDGFGHYTVMATFTYGKKNQSIDVTQTFWVVPLWVIITGAVSLIVLIGVIVAVSILIRNSRRRKASSFSSHRRR